MTIPSVCINPFEIVMTSPLLNHVTISLTAAILVEPHREGVRDLANPRPRLYPPLVRFCLRTSG